MNPTVGDGPHKTGPSPPPTPAHGLGEHPPDRVAPVARPTDRSADPDGGRDGRPVHKPTGASLVVVIAVAVVLVVMTALHIVRRDIDPLNDVMSHYANGTDGPLMSFVFYAFGLSAIALGFRLRTAIDHDGVTRLFPHLMVVAGLALVTAGIFEVDRPDAPETLGEAIHSNAAVGAFVLLIVAMLLFSLACQGDERWRSVRWASLGLSLLAACAAAATQLSRGSGTSGGVQRVLAGAVLAWFLLTALHVRRRRFGAA